MRYVLLALLAFSFVLSQSINAAWPHLGELSQFDANATHQLPDKLDPEKNALFALDLPGPGASTPLVVADRIILTCEIDGANGVVCYDTNGKELWRHSFGKTVEGKHRNATGANPSATTDGKHVAVYFKDASLACYTIDGQQLWQTNLTDEFGKGELWWDLGTSPVTSSRGVVMAVMQAGESYLATFDYQTGDVLWQTPRNYKCAIESDQSYTTPTVIDVDGVETIVTFGADHLTGHNARTGKLLWEYAGLNPNNEGMWRTIASAAVDEGVAVVPFGRGEFVSGVKLGGSGDITESGELWTVEGVGSDVPTPQIVNGCVYVLGDGKATRGTVTCLDLQSGKELWADKLPRARGGYYSSPLVVADRLYCIQDDGKALVCRINNGLELLSKAELDELVVATPVLLGDDILVRTRSKLYRFGVEN